MPKQAFDEYADKYDSWFLKNEAVLDSEVALLAHFLANPGRTLSVGCGSGLFEALLKKDHKIIIEEGLEPADNMAEIAIKRGMKVGFLVSPSVDGEIPAKIVSARGATVIRGSSTRTGAKALRDMFLTITRDKISPVTTSDGPTGPVFKFKPGAVMLSQMTKAPMLPIACSANKAWHLGSWDRFMIPKPFTKVVVAVGELVSVSPERSSKDLSPVQNQMELAINELMVQAKAAL